MLTTNLGNNLPRAMSNSSLNSSHLSGSLLTDSRARFDEWKRQLVFQYDFVKVILRCTATHAFKGLLQENDLYRSEMDRMEIKLRDIQSLQAKEIGDLGSQLTTGHCNSISNPFSSVTKSSGQESSSQKTTAVILIDGNTFVVLPVGFDANLFCLDRLHSPQPRLCRRLFGCSKAPREIRLYPGI